MERKYLSDYRVTERVDAAGRVRREREYIGGRYCYALGPAALKRAKTQALVLCAVGWASFAAALMPDSAASRTFYAVFPFLFAAIPIGLVTEIVLSAPKGEEPMERRQADKLTDRYPAAAVFIVILSALSLVGEGVYGLLGGAYMTGDIVFSLCSAFLAMCGVLLLIKRRSFDIRRI